MTGGVTAHGDDPHYQSIGVIGGYREPARQNDQTIEPVYTENHVNRPQLNVDSSVLKSSAQMIKEETFVGWDFVDVWDINEDEDYPDLIDNSRW